MFTLLEKYAEEKKDSSGIGQMLGGMSGMTLSALIGPRIAARASSKVMPGIEDMVNSPEFFEKNVKDTAATFMNKVPGGTAAEYEEAARAATSHMRGEALNEFIKKPDNPYFREAQKMMGKASRKTMLASLALGLSLPILGSIAGNAFEKKISNRK